MKVRVHYTNGIVSDIAIKDFDELLSFGKRFTILSQTPLTEKETEEYMKRVGNQPTFTSHDSGPR